MMFIRITEQKRNITLQKIKKSYIINYHCRSQKISRHKSKKLPLINDTCANATTVIFHITLPPQATPLINDTCANATTVIFHITLPPQATWRSGNVFAVQSCSLGSIPQQKEIMAIIKSKLNQNYHTKDKDHSDVN